jgi:hypothetical protein
MKAHRFLTPFRRRTQGIRPYIPGSKLQIPSPSSKVAPLVRRVMGLMTECERVDSMTVSEDRSEALQILLDRIEWFEDEISNTVKDKAIEEAVDVFQTHPN